MDYQRQYELLIAKHGTHDKPTGYSERHHIVPKSMGGSDHTSNLTYLSAKAHFVAHHLLWRWHGAGPMAYAHWAMVSMGKHKVTSRSFELARKAMADEAAKRVGSLHPLFGVTGEDHPSYGTTRNSATKAKMSKSKSGKNNPSARVANLYCFNTGLLLAKGVVLHNWAKENGYDTACLSKTASGERKQHKGIYAQYTT